MSTFVDLKIFTKFPLKPVSTGLFEETTMKDRLELLKGKMDIIYFILFIFFRQAGVGFFSGKNGSLFLVFSEISPILSLRCYLSDRRPFRSVRAVSFPGILYCSWQIFSRHGKDLSPKQNRHAIFLDCFFHFKTLEIASFEQN